jgi:hypothetical protein
VTSLLETHRVDFRKAGDTWWLECVRCDWVRTPEAMPPDTNAWTYDVQRHACNLNFYTDADRASSARRMQAHD